MKEIITKSGDIFQVSDHRFEYLNQWKWWIAINSTKKKYALRWETGSTHAERKAISMHREILGMDRSDKRHADHIDGNTQNNQDENLRIATRSQNGANRPKDSDKTGRFKGVYKTKSGKHYAMIMKDKKQNYLGIHDTDIQAAMAYNAKAIELFGEFAKINEI